MARKLTAIAFSLGCLHASSVMALGLGELTLESFLNEPLKASVDLLNTEGLHDDEIKIRLATREDFDKLDLERAYFLTSIKFDVKMDDRGNARIVVSSEDPVLEPYLDFIIEARWPSGRLLREYTVLVDPPVFSDATPVVSASDRVAEVEGILPPGKKKQETGASTGTTVGIRKSDLAPGAMPQRDYNAATSPTPEPGSRYMISRDETLWAIALKARPEGASVHQTMLDIQRLNPDAFINGNINRVKAGYIVYLPDSADISSADLAAALAEVRQQNEDWRQGRESQPSSSSGPSLRISAEPDDVGDTTEAPVGDQRTVGSSAAALEDKDKSALEQAEATQRLAEMEQQVETLQRIVSLKDDQIAALQGALADAGGSQDAAAVVSGLEGELAEEVMDADDAPEVASDTDDALEDELSVSEEVVSVEVDETPQPVAAATAAVKPAPPAQSKPPAATTPAESGGGFMSYILYILGAVVLAVLGFLFMRRRGADSEAPAVPAPAPAPVEDVFSDVELKGQELELEIPEDIPVGEALAADGEQAPPAEDSRGYGERKNDEYANDAEATDALAEADIYIAYGRHSQAIDLLNNAIANEPGNPLYRLKLLETQTELGDHDAALQQFEKLQEIAEPDSLARAQALLDGLPADAPTAAGSESGDGPGLPPSPIELMSEADEPLEDFSGLEIEETGLAGATGDELDLSGDFTGGDQGLNGDDQELVIAAESNGFSTKLDLARAYLDMGDDDGARQILEEVAAEGNEETQAEAKALLERIG